MDKTEARRARYWNAPQDPPSAAEGFWGKRLKIRGPRADRESMKTTDSERRLLTAIRDNEHNAGLDPTGNPVWVNSIDFPADSHGGVMSSLVKKGLAGGQDNTDGDLCWITSEGMEAIA